jgi:hypothetical protein
MTAGLVADADAIPAPAIASSAQLHVSTYNDVLPEGWFDEENVQGYPFRVQSITGGIPVPPHQHLTGSTQQPIRLTGSLKTTRRLTGSVSGVRYGSGTGKRRVSTGPPRVGGTRRR